MATLSITVPDAQVQRVLDAIEFNIGIEPGTATAATARQFIVDHLKAVVKDYEERAAIIAARESLPTLDATP